MKHLLTLIATALPCATLHAQAQTPAAPVHIACVGDSISVGKQTPGYCYPSQLERMLGREAEIGNFGVSGSVWLKFVTDSPTRFGFGTVAIAK